MYAFDHIRRFINKLFGRRANRKTAIFAEMLAKLEASVASALPSLASVTHAVVTSPDGICLTDSEMDDVLDYLHMKNLMEAPDRLYTLSAAFAGTGHGLCKEYTKLYRCEVEDHLDFSNQALRMTTKRMQTYKAFGGGEAVLDTQLGFVEGLGDKESDMLFKRIGEKIRSFAQSRRRKITMILLTGSRVGEHRFKETLRNALEDIVTSQAIRDFDRSFFDDVGLEIHTVFATAKGAAEVAKRRLEAPVRCLWRDNCRALNVEKRSGGPEESLELYSNAETFTNLGLICPLIHIYLFKTPVGLPLMIRTLHPTSRAHESSYSIHQLPRPHACLPSP
jgi:hypothetical protein